MLQKLLFLKFSLPKLQKHSYFFLWAVLFSIFMRQTLANDFWGLHKSMNCAFPLMIFECIFAFDIDRKFNFNH